MVEITPTEEDIFRQHTLLAGIFRRQTGGTQEPGQAWAEAIIQGAALTHWATLATEAMAVMEVMAVYSLISATKTTITMANAI
jgi:hypothetical protein